VGQRHANVHAKARLLGRETYKRRREEWRLWRRGHM
jgi:hypothetical protein